MQPFAWQSPPVTVLHHPDVVRVAPNASRSEAIGSPAKATLTTSGATSRAPPAYGIWGRTECSSLGDDDDDDPQPSPTSAARCRQVTSRQVLLERSPRIGKRLLGADHLR